MKYEGTWITTVEGTTRVTDSDRLIRKQAPLFEWAQKTFAGAEVAKPRARNGSGGRPKPRSRR